MLANVTPLRENGKVTGFLSVRTRPSQQQINDAEKLYKAVNDGKTTLQPSRIKRAIQYARSIKIKTWMTVYALGVMTLLTGFTWLGYQQISPVWLMLMLGGVSVLLAIAAFIFNRYINSPVEQGGENTRAIGGWRFFRLDYYRSGR